MYYRRKFYRRILEGYEVGQIDPTEINVQQETIANYFQHCKICSGDAVSKNLNEPTCENVIHKLEVMINDLDYHNKMDVNNLLDYSGESDTCSEVQNLEEFVDTIGKRNVDDEVEDDTISFDPLRVRKHSLHLELFTILWFSSKRQDQSSWMQ
ncbi:uncharacterized protein LOC125819224 [Solanum verrucosum]|uniref:uncharacterized protein LOC125819224 n=1 Tax=Solanum verrucosum TaxID=315347 RepID=UPI0020D10F44|nr:uncharacterized protein LOC125819224 [Solanum verrucosum]